MPAVRSLLAAEHRRIRHEYEQRLATIEAEHKVMEEDKAQVDRYKSLLLKQRDIMIALTARLNERDEQIVSLQEELDARDRHQKDLEDTLDKRTGELFRLRKAAVEHTTASPLKSDALVSALGAWGAGGGDERAARGGGALAGGSGSAPSADGDHKAAPSGEAAGGASADAAAAAAAAAEAGGAMEEELRLARREAAEARATVEAQAAQLKALREQRGEAGGGAGAGGDAATGGKDGGELERLRVATGVANKERAALRTILEHKVAALVRSISSGVAALPEGAAARSAPRLEREVHALGKLVSATVTAMQASKQQ